MSWLFLIGVACDGVGAFMIAWPILHASSAAREAGRPRWGGDHWAPFVRDRETRLVQYEPCSSSEDSHCKQRATWFGSADSGR